VLKRPQRIEPTDGQESVWDYPRPPRVEATPKRIRVEFNGQIIADTTRAIRVLETSHPPSYYIPREDIQMEHFSPTQRHTHCEFKGEATYWTIKVGDKVAKEAGWSYEIPNKSYQAIRGYLCFYANRVDACYVNDEKVIPQEGDFYGGWITSDIVGPFKGSAGTWGW
jgi:uncharacterized protein (DUF427 family)